MNLRLSPPLIDFLLHLHHLQHFDPLWWVFSSAVRCSKTGDWTRRGFPAATAAPWRSLDSHYLDNQVQTAVASEADVDDAVDDDVVVAVVD